MLTHRESERLQRQFLSIYISYISAPLVRRRTRRSVGLDIFLSVTEMTRTFFSLPGSAATSPVEMSDILRELSLRELRENLAETCV